MSTQENWFIPQINDFVSLGTAKKPKQGYIRYIGPLIGAKYNGIFYGIELDQSIGKNNGSLDGNKYFQCKKNYGLFTKRNKIKKIILKNKSFEYKMELVMTHFMGESLHRLPFEIYQMISFYIPPQKLTFTKDQRGINWFKIHKSRLRAFSPTRGVKADPYKGHDGDYGGKKKWNPKIALLRFKDNSGPRNDLGTIHQTFPIRQWKHNNFKKFKLSLFLKCIGHFSQWTIPFDSDDGDETTQYPRFLVLDAFKANEYQYKDKKIWLNITFGKNGNLPRVEFDKWQIHLFGERINDGNQWRYWVETGKEFVSKKIEPNNPIEIGFEFPYMISTWSCVNSNVQILKQKWTFY